MPLLFSFHSYYIKTTSSALTEKKNKQTHSYITGIYWFTQEKVGEVKFVCDGCEFVFLGLWWFYVHFIQCFQSFPKKQIKHVSETM